MLITQASTEEAAMPNKQNITGMKGRLENKVEHQQIIVNADYHAGLRGFNFNDEVQDWLEAEEEIDVALHNRKNSDH